jgi:hypothetical protein
MNLSGQILDFYDDPKLLRDCWPALEDVPEHVKTAHVLSPDELAGLPDDLFAVVLVDGGNRLRKFACVDGGNTEINCQVFLKHAHRFPEEARKTAAQNLLTACGWYGVEPSEELRKEAIGLMGAANLAILGPSVVKGTHHSIQQNMGNVHAMEGGGAVVPPALMKAAEISGTSMAPNQPPGYLSQAVAGKKGTAFNLQAEKTGGHLVPGHSGEAGEELEHSRAVPGEQYQRAPQAKALKGHVDVTGKEPAAPAREKKANQYALEGRYPLDSYVEVKQASQYFDTYANVMSPRDRHEFAVAMTKRASELGLTVSDDARRAGSTTYASAGEIKIGFDARLQYMDGPAREMLEGLWRERAGLEPDVFCEALAGIDKVAMLDWAYGQYIPDPWTTTYGLEKRASDNDTWLSGNDYVTKDQIEQFGLTSTSTLEGSFGSEFGKEFRRDPWGIFQSLPLLQKRRIARMATDNSPTGKVHVP